MKSCCYRSCLFNGTFDNKCVGDGDEVFTFTTLEDECLSYCSENDVFDLPDFVTFTDHDLVEECYNPTDTDNCN